MLVHGYGLEKLWLAAQRILDRQRARSKRRLPAAQAALGRPATASDDLLPAAPSRFARRLLACGAFSLRSSVFSAVLRRPRGSLACGALILAVVAALLGSRNSRYRSPFARQLTLLRHGKQQPILQAIHQQANRTLARKPAPRRICTRRRRYGIDATRHGGCSGLHEGGRGGG